MAGQWEDDTGDYDWNPTPEAPTDNEEAKSNNDDAD